MDTKRTAPIFAFFYFLTYLSLSPMAASAKANQNTPDSNSNSANKSLGPVTPPKAIHTVSPTVPGDFMKRLRTTTVVNVRVSVLKDGTPADIHVDQVVQIQKNTTIRVDPNSDPLLQNLAKAAVDAVSQYRFKPAKQNGEPVVVFLNVTVKFTP